MSHKDDMTLMKPRTDDLRAAMRSRGMRQVGLAALASCSKMTAHKVANGGSTYRSIALRISEALGRDMETLFDEVVQDVDVTLVPLNGDRIRAAAEIAGLSIPEVSRRMGNHETNLTGKLLSGQKHTTRSYITSLAAVLRVPVEELDDPSEGLGPLLTERLRLARDRLRRARKREERSIAASRTARVERPLDETLRQRAMLLRKSIVGRTTFGEMYSTRQDIRSAAYEIIGNKRRPLTPRRLLAAGLDPVPEEASRPRATPSADILEISRSISLALLIADDPERMAAYKRVATCPDDELDRLEQAVDEIERTGSASRNRGAAHAETIPVHQEVRTPAESSLMRRTLLEMATEQAVDDGQAGTIFARDGCMGVPSHVPRRISVVCADPGHVMTWSDEQGRVRHVPALEGTEVDVPEGSRWSLSSERVPARAILRVELRTDQVIKGTQA